MDPVTISDMTAAFTAATAQKPPELVLSFDEYVNQDLPSAFDHAKATESTPLETSKVAIRWTCQDGWSDVVENSLDRERYPQGYFYASSLHFVVDDSQPPPKELANARSAHPFMHLRLPCELTLNYYHELSVARKPSERKQTKLFQGCLNRSGIAPGPC